MTTIQEIRELRENYGHDKRAINRHSVRYYDVGGKVYLLDRTTDAIPPCFCLYELKHDPRSPESEWPLAYFPPTVEIGGKRYWGDGWSWRRAEAVMAEAL